MSSSKVFKGDTLFTPHSLIRQSIDPPVKGAKKPAHQPAPPAQEISPEIQQVEQQQPKQDPIPKRPSKPAPPPTPEPPPEPPVDVEALRQEGYNKGAADCAAKMQAEFEQTMRSFVGACQKIDNLRQERLASSHGDLINLVISLTEKVIGQELATQRNQIAATLETALEQAISSEEFHITLHPDDLAFAEEKAPALITATRGLEHLVFKTDPGIRRGGCLLESVTCTVDATIDGKLESVRELLEEHPELLLSSEEAADDLPVGTSAQDENKRQG